MLVYDLKYHVVWISKYRKDILDKEISDYLKATFNKIAEEFYLLYSMVGHFGLEPQTPCV